MNRLFDVFPDKIGDENYVIITWWPEFINLNLKKEEAIRLMAEMASVLEKMN